MGRSGWRFWVLGVYAIVVTGVIYTAFSHWGYDDPYITYRYADNLARGLGFVYNPGELVLSTTTPFFTLLLAVLANLWADIPRMAILVGAFSLALGGIFLWDLAYAWETPAAGWTGLLLYPAFPLLVSTVGSETPLYLAFCLGAFAFFARQRFSWMAVFAALAVLTRPDGALVPMVLGVGYLVWGRPYQRPFPWKAVLLFLGLVLPWFLFAWGYFGSPVPVTLAAKQHQAMLPGSQRFISGFINVMQGYGKFRLYWIEAGLALLGVAWMVWRKHRWVLILSWTLLYFIAYTVLGVSRYFWYYAPLVPGFLAFVGVGLSFVCRRDDPCSLWASSRGKSSGPSLIRPDSVASEPDVLIRSHPSVTSGWQAVTRMYPFARGLLLVLALTLLASLTYFQGEGLARLRSKNDRRLPVYRAIGEWLAENTLPDASVGALEVGIIGYYARHQMIDFAGLIQPEVASQLRADTTYQEAALWAVDRYRPDYLVLHDGIFPQLELGYVAERCQATQRFSGEQYNYSMNLTVYSCR